MIRRLSLAAATACATPAFAQDAPPPAWTGEGAFNAGYTTGNTETRDAGVAVKLKHAGERWSQSGELAADYAETDVAATKNRVAAAFQVDRSFSETWSAYGRATWEQDEFSGFETRYFLGLGAAWKAIETPATGWTLEGGPGYKADTVRLTGETEESLGLRLASRFAHTFNERVSLSNDSQVVYSDTSTQLQNTVALTSNLMGNLSARVSFDVRHDTDALPGFEATDTTTKVSLVYKIG